MKRRGFGNLINGGEGEEGVKNDDQVSGIGNWMPPTEVGSTKDRAGLEEVGEFYFWAFKSELRRSTQWLDT